MDPLTLMAIGQGVGATGGIISALLGRNAQADAISRQTNEDALQRLLAERIYAAQTAPQVDARGNRVEYIPGVGWIATPSSLTRQNILAGDQEQLNQFIDAGRERRGAQQEDVRRMQAGLGADALLDEITRGPETSREGIRSVLANRNRGAVNRAYDKTVGATATQALRSGASNAGEVLNSLSRQRGEAVRGAEAGTDQEARAAFGDLQNERANKGNLFALLSQRAQGGGIRPRGPSSAATELQSAVQGLRGSAGNAGWQLLQGSKATPMGPDFSTANLFGGSLANIGSQIGQYGQAKQYEDLLKSIFQTQVR